VKENVPDMKNRMVKVMEFRTPGQDGTSINTDRDYRVCYYGGLDRGTGKERWIEVDRRQWEDHSYQTFARLTGGPADSPEAAKHWAEQHQQLGTDKAHAEASPDFTDQARIWNPQSQKFENVQIIPNILRVKAGQPGARLKDPQALGQMYQLKVADAKFKPEAFVQAQKAVKELDAIREGYAKQNLKVGNLPPAVQNGMNAVIEVNQRLAADPNRRDPKAVSDAEKTLHDYGFQSLGDFMNKLSGQFEALKNVKE
jgi:ATP-dependent exoDNAse (exonuclease V) beta subunit